MKDLDKLLAQLIIMINLVGHPADQITHDINSGRYSKPSSSYYDTNKIVSLRVYQQFT